MTQSDPGTGAASSGSTPGTGSGAGSGSSHDEDQFQQFLRFFSGLKPTMPDADPTPVNDDASKILSTQEDNFGEGED